MPYRPPVGRMVVESLFIMLLAFIFVLIVFAFGVFYDANRLPNCEEDEVLVARDYPYDDAGDLKCLHVEEVYR